MVDQHRRLLLKVCWMYAGTQHDRDDLLQEIVAQLWASFGRYDRQRKFSTWMYRVALNVAIDFQRRQRRYGNRRTELSEQDGCLPGDVIARHEETEQLIVLRRTLATQNDADRALLLLHLEGNSYREIGEILGISESNVGTRLSRIKDGLRKSLRQDA
ncbi:MAG: sigma-70 family RNA polymerase sigma factor [Pirellulales bacterium]